MTNGIENKKKRKMGLKRESQVIVVMGSQSDLRVMHLATELLEKFDVRVETQILSAHRTPELLAKSVSLWEKNNIMVIIAGAGGAAHLPGMIASFSYLPVIGVPIKSKAMGGLDSLLSIAQMPKGVPVATVAVDNAENAALLAAQILSLSENSLGKALRSKVIKYKSTMQTVIKKQRQELGSVSVSEFMKNIKKS
jgi:5-(carboxyamino)imidazole ribonucleotide mutase